MKKIALICLVAMSTKMNSQIYLGEKCSIKFFSKTKMEDIDAENKVTKPILNTKDGHFIIQASQTGFIFKSSFMQEHYNENYMESEKYPFTKFDGIISEKIDYTVDGIHEVTMVGKISLHGVELPRTITGTMVIKGGIIILDSKFELVVADFKIVVPSLYVDILAKSVQVSFHAEMTPHKK